MPVGLPKRSPGRRADDEAAALVGKSVFPTYPRVVYEEESHAHAVKFCKARGWPGISLQSYGLGKRIFEVEPHTQRVTEVHPEVSFWAMNGFQRPPSKDTWNGLQIRRRLLRDEGIRFPEQLDLTVGSIDLLDAAAAAWSARRVRRDAKTLPDDPAPGEPTITY